MFEPLDTTAKQDMAELALTQVEGILRDLMEDDKRELVFTRYQMEQEVETDPERRRQRQSCRRALARRVRGGLEAVLRAAQDRARLAEPGPGRG